MKRLISIALILLLSSSITFAQDFCKGDFNYNGSVAAEDVSTFLEHFGRSQFNNPCPPDGPAPVAKTGQTTSYATGDDGDLERGVAVTPRFTDNLDGTVTDNQTGLIWLQNANCFGQRTWNNALSACNGLENGECGLIDGSQAGDWRLSSRFELESLLDMAYDAPPLPNTAGTGKWSQGDPFNNVLFSIYWLSTTFIGSTSFAWTVHMGSGGVAYRGKSIDYYVWCVRGGQHTPPTSTTTTSVEFGCDNPDQCGPDYCCCYTTHPEDCQGYTACCVMRDLCESLSTCMQ